MEYGLNVHRPENLSLIDKAAQAGVRIIRCDWDWFRMEPQKNHYAWDVTDAIVDRAIANHLQIFATIAYAPQWANGSTDPHVCPRGPEYASFAGANASRYKGHVKYWGLWNEPNLDYYEGSKQDYIDNIVIPGSTAIRNNDLLAKVCGPGLAHMGSLGKDKYWWAWWKFIARHRKYFDVWTHHIYKEPTYWEMWRCLDGFTFSWYEGPNLKNARRKSKVNDHEFIITETGWGSKEGEGKQADAYRDWFKGSPEHTKVVDAVLFYELVDSTVSKSMKGLLKADYTEKEAYKVVQENLRG